MRITTTALAERLAKLEDLVADQGRRLERVSSRTLTPASLEARRTAMQAARNEALRTGHSVKVQA